MIMFVGCLQMYYVCYFFQFYMQMLFSTFTFILNLEKHE